MVLLSRRDVLGLGLSCLAGAARAADYPSQHVQFICPFSPATGADTAARLVAARLGKDWGVPVTVENKVGANGIIGAEVVAKAKPDGYTLAFTASTHLVNQTLYKTLPFHTVNDFKPVAKVSNTFLVLVVPTSSPVSTLQELIAYARARPRALYYSSGGNGSALHLAGALMNSMAGTEINHVPYKGGAQALTDVMSGQVFCGFTAISTAAAGVQGGRLKAIAVTGLRRSAALPDVPTLDEAGLKGFEMVAWSGILAPAGTPDEIARKVSDSAVRVARTPEFAEAMKAQGLEAEPVGFQRFAEDYPREAERWARIVALSGARIE